jgi:hypothetical protein
LPNWIGGRTLLSEVSPSDKSRIMAEMRSILKERGLDNIDDYTYDKNDVEAEWVVIDCYY